MGFNAVRKHIKVEPDRWYYWADKLGLMVWQDMPAANTGPIPPEWRDQFEAELHEMVREHQQLDLDRRLGAVQRGLGRVGPGRHRPDRRRRQGPGPEPAGQRAQRRELLQLARATPARATSSTSTSTSARRRRRRTANRVSIDGEHGGFGLKTSNHMWFGDGQAYEMEPDSATLTAQVRGEPAGGARPRPSSCGISAAIYTQITDVEGELNGFFTYDRQVAKMDFTQVRAINQKIIARGGRLGGQRAAAARRARPG